MNSWDIPMLEKDLDGSSNIAYLQLGDLFGGRCGIVTTVLGSNDYYAPQKSDPSRYGYRRCAVEDIPPGYEVYKYERLKKSWNEGTSYRAQDSDPIEQDKNFKNKTNLYSSQKEDILENSIKKVSNFKRALTMIKVQENKSMEKDNDERSISPNKN